jgi:hypothetical protein
MYVSESADSRGTGAGRCVWFGSDSYYMHVLSLALCTSHFALDGMRWMNNVMRAWPAILWGTN